MKNEKDDARRTNHATAVFIDLENLYPYLAGGRHSVTDRLSEILSGVKSQLKNQFESSCSVLRAYADYGDIERSYPDSQQALYAAGIEPRFVPVSVQSNAAEIQLCVDVMELLSNRPDIRHTVFITGDRPYLPLVHHVLRSGRSVLMVGSEDLAHLTDTVLMDGFHFTVLSKWGDRKAGNRKSAEEGTTKTSSQNGESATKSASQKADRSKVDYQAVTGYAAYRTLELIEEHFGQYEEIFLTPLLRRLSEEMDDILYDPKQAIGELEAAGAIWLEKRRGHPHEFTVLLVDQDHPDVIQIKESVFERNQLKDEFEFFSLKDHETDDPYDPSITSDSDTPDESAPLE